MLLIIINGERDKRFFKFLSSHRIMFISLWRSQSIDDVLWSFLWLEQIVEIGCFIKYIMWLISLSLWRRTIFSSLLSLNAVLEWTSVCSCKAVGKFFSNAWHIIWCVKCSYPVLLVWIQRRSVKKQRLRFLIQSLSLHRRCSDWSLLQRWTARWLYAWWRLPSGLYTL